MSGGEETPDWAEKLKELRGLPFMPKDLAKAGWLVPAEKDALEFSIDGWEENSDSFKALPSSLTISNPDFITPPLDPQSVSRLISDSIRVKIPDLWIRTGRKANVLTVKVNDRPGFSTPLDFSESPEDGEVIGKLQAAVCEALRKVVDDVETLKRRHVPGTAEPGSHRIAFNLATVSEGDSAAGVTLGH